MNTALSKSSQCYGLYDFNGKQIAFIAILHFPNPGNLKIKRIHRMVVLPDYQGIGLGGVFLDCIAQMYKNKGYDVRIVSSAKNLIYKLDKSQKWKLTHYGIIKNNSKTEKKNDAWFTQKSKSGIV